MSKIDAIKKSILHVGMAAKGRKDFLAHLSGKRTTQRQGILAKCYDCCGYYADGKNDCKLPECPLYPWMPFKDSQKQEPDASKIKN